MSKTILVTGGYASGKSRWVVTHFEACDYVLYLCPDAEMDADIQKRIRYGNEKNYVEWDIKTGVTDSPQSYITDHKFVVLDSLASYVRANMDSMCPDEGMLSDDMVKEVAKKVIDDITAMYEVIKEIDGSMTIVTLETGFSVAPEDRRRSAFGKILGIVNQRIANMSTEVYLSVSGIQFQIKS
ncbi:MAG: bifunctional adenosylcobinamide kinase/adenosylcobinamide-phosphate guanylyltransferase [Lachnospiraceae bacterium]|nr:bifunctional adenosylcobinamide kinase/adenosylcobinamide-phosphate guanylyltransferase [Lachnospiraceae bacterium]